MATCQWCGEHKENPVGMCPGCGRFLPSRPRTIVDRPPTIYIRSTRDPTRWFVIATYANVDDPRDHAERDARLYRLMYGSRNVDLRL